MAHAGGRPLKFTSVDQIQKIADEYFAKRIKDGMPFTISGLAYELDIDTQTLLNYQDKDQYFATIKRIKQRCENYAEEQVFLGKNQAGAIFVLKNHKWRDQQQTDITSNGNTLNGLVSIEPPDAPKE